MYVVSKLISSIQQHFTVQNNLLIIPFIIMPPSKAEKGSYTVFLGT